MEKITTIGVDLAKSVFQVHAVDAAGRVVVTKALRRRDMEPFFSRLPPCLIGLEACASSHHWGRLLSLMGHEVRLRCCQVNLGGAQATQPQPLQTVAAAHAASASARKRRSVGRLIRCRWRLKVL